MNPADVEPADVDPADLVEAALAVATGPVSVLVVERTEANVRWANSALTTNGEMHSRSLTVVATAQVEGGTAVGTVSRDLADASGVAGIVAAAEETARTGPPSEDAAPAVEGAAEDGWTEPPAATSIDTLAAVAVGLGSAFAKAAEDGHVLFGFAEHVVTTTYLGTSTGLRRRGVQPSGRLELNAKSADGARSAWAGAATRDFTDVDVAELYAGLATRLGWARTRIDLPPGRYETILPPSALADLLIYAFWTANARDAEDGRNVYAAGEGRTRIGERLTPQPLTLRSDPGYPGLQTVPFVDYLFSQDGTTWAFDLGMPIEPTTWIDGGVLSDLVRNRAHAARTGLPASPPADNLVLEGGGTATLEQLVATTKRGLLLTCLWYIREVDPERLLLTGLTRDGVYLIEDGQVVGAVNNFRFNESPIELLGRFIEVGASEPTLCREWNDWVNRTVMPPVRIADFNMSTVSRAF